MIVISSGHPVRKNIEINEAASEKRIVFDKKLNFELIFFVEIVLFVFISCF